MSGNDKSASAPPSPPVDMPATPPRRRASGRVPPGRRGRCPRGRPTWTRSSTAPSTSTDSGRRRSRRRTRSGWPPRQGGFVWLGLYEPTEEELEAIADRYGLHPLAVEDAVYAYQRPKLEHYDDALFMVLKTGALRRARAADRDQRGGRHRRGDGLPRAVVRDHRPARRARRPGRPAQPARGAARPARARARSGALRGRRPRRRQLRRGRRRGRGGRRGAGGVGLRHRRSRTTSVGSTSSSAS